MRGKSARVLYLLLFVWGLISISYYIAGAAALREEWFHGDRHARAPFDFKADGQAITELRPEAKDAGLSDGDVLRSLNGKPYTGWAQYRADITRSQPTDLMQAGVREANGRMKAARIRLRASEPPPWGVGGLIAFLTPILGVPLLGLMVGYWVVAARPHDPNAWLVLLLLSFTETAFGNLDWTFWPGPSYVVFWVWHVLLQILSFVALVWFGIYFPERWRLDIRWPWFKWLILATGVYGTAMEGWVSAARQFDARRTPALMGLEFWTDRIVNWTQVVCVVVFLIAIFDKLRSASTPDGRLRVLAIGSGLSLGPLLIMFSVLPYLGYDPHHGSLFEVAVPFVALFPLTLAYVLIVQRAMDVRILLRMGTKYVLAKATLRVLEIGIGAFVVLRFIVPMMERREHQMLTVVLVLVVMGGLFWAFMRRDSLSSRVQRWLDRKFFREAYNSEVVLSELSEQARTFTDTGPLIETVSRRISEVLHGATDCRLAAGQQCIPFATGSGVDVMGPVMLLEGSATVQNLARTNRPATVYRDRPEEWFERAEPEEREILERVRAELLLPLPGRERLMGLMALDPKNQSSPTRLRICEYCNG